MPIVHLIARWLKETYSGQQLLWAGLALGFVGFVMVVEGVFVKGDTRQTLLGLIGGIFFWTGWVDFLLMYYAARYGTQPEIDPQTHALISRPEYLLMPATFGLWAMVMMLYILSSRNACNFLNWWQSKLLGSRKQIIARQGMTRHTSVITFMEINTMLWTCYLLLMLCYDPLLLGRTHPVTFAVGLGAFYATPFIFFKQLKRKQWGANIRMAVATVIVCWIGIESFNRTGIVAKLYQHPSDYPYHWIVFAVETIYLGWVILKRYRHKA